MSITKQHWLDAIGYPSVPMSDAPMTLLRRFNEPEFDGELYRQALDDHSSQRVFFVFPKHFTHPVPVVIVPFYFPEAMLGYDPATGETLPRFAGIEMMLHLVRRGYAAVSADAYHLTYLNSVRERDDFRRWHDAGTAIRVDHPGWSGMGKLIADTRRMTDAAVADPRIDPNRVGIAGHSLGGKMAFYSGCIDERIRVILASDFGIGWEQTNWRDIWYWGDRVDDLIAEGMDHAALISCAAPKPFCLLAGQYDNAESGRIMRSAAGYKQDDPRLRLIWHATGHRPPAWALEEGYRFLDTWL